MPHGRLSLGSQQVKQSNFGQSLVKKRAEMQLFILLDFYANLDRTITRAELEFWRRFNC